MSDPPPDNPAPSGRQAPKQVRTAYRHISGIPHLRDLLNAFPTPAVILNNCRQIVAANQWLCACFGRREEELLGMRIGEALRCSDLGDSSGECGTSRICETCGALQAILNAQRSGVRDVRECTLTLSTDEGKHAVDLRVTASSLDLSGRFTLLALNDISDEKRRAVLEQMFFHDVLNTALGVTYFLEVLPTQSERSCVEGAHSAFQMAQSLLKEIEAGKDLVAAERGELALRVTPLDARKILKEVRDLYANQSVSRGRELVIKKIIGPCTITTDSLLLQRVLGNLVKNALEASEAGQKVGLAYENRGAPLFRVHNEAAMPDEVQLQVFKRSFSTKSPLGRGIGTYSAKLITERYLGGSLSFTSCKDEGTTFTVALPAQGPG